MLSFLQTYQSVRMKFTVLLWHFFFLFFFFPFVESPAQLILLRSQGRGPYIGEFIGNTFSIGLCSDNYDLINFKLGIMIKISELFCLISVSMTLMFIQGHRVMRKPELWMIIQSQSSELIRIRLDTLLKHFISWKFSLFCVTWLVFKGDNLTLVTS